MTEHKFEHRCSMPGEDAPTHVVTVTINRDAPLDSIVDSFRGYLIACGFRVKNVDEAFRKI